MARRSKKDLLPGRASQSQDTAEAPIAIAIEPEILPAEPKDEELTPEDIATEVEVLPPDALDIAESESLEPVVEEKEATSTEVVPYDSFKAYLQEIQRYPRLSKEEEHSIALKYFTEKDREAAYKLISSNLWLVVKIARDYERAARSILDLVQEGNMGLMEAVKNFDPYRNVRFPSYAVWWIKAYIVRYVIANWRLVKIGTTQAQRKLFFNLKKEKEKLEREGFFPAPKLIAEKLNVKEQEVIEMEQRLAGSDMSVDAPLDGEGDANLLSVIPNSSSTAEELMAHKEMRALLDDAMTEFATTLNEKELMIFKERMLGEDKATLQDIAEKLSLSRERIRQLENRIQEKLKVYLTEKLGSSLSEIEW